MRAAHLLGVYMPFAPSMRLIRAAVNKGRAMLYFFSKGDEEEQKYTVSSGME